MIRRPRAKAPELGTLKLRGRRALPLYAAVSPYYLLFALFSAAPILFTAFISITNWSGLGDFQIIGLKNFEYLLTDKLFWKSFANTLILWVMSTIPCLTLATLVALALNSSKRFSNTYRVVYLLPNVTSMVAMGILFSSIFSSNFGLANAFLNMIGVGNIPWLQTEWGIKIAISALSAWSFVGYNALIILAGLQAIPKEIYEAASLEGAGPVRQFFHITLPLLRPIVMFVTIMSTIGSLQSFTESQVLTSAKAGSAAASGGVGNSGLTMVMYFYSVAFQENRYGYGAAIAWGIVVIVLVFAIINFIATKERRA